MGARSLYRRLRDSPSPQPPTDLDAKTLLQLLKLSMNERDPRVATLLLSRTSLASVALIEAIASRDERLVVFLLSLGASVETRAPTGRTPIHEALRLGQMSILEALLAHCPVDADVVDSDGLGHLHAACASGNLELARRLLDASADPRRHFRRELSRERSTTLGALHLAVQHSHAAVVELLIERGAEVNAPDELYGLTPLHLACNRALDYSRLDIARSLLERGADVGARDRRGNTPLHAVFSRDSRLRTTVTTFDCALIGVEDDATLGGTVADEGDKVELLLSHGANPADTNDEGDGALHLVVRSMEALRRPRALAKVTFDDRRHVELTTRLLRAGAPVDATNLKGQSPLQLAASMLSLDVVQLLLKHGADPERIRFDEICYSADVIPSLEATENLLGIVERLSSRGLVLDKRSNLAVLEFLIGNHTNCRYDVWTDRNASYKLKNLLELGTDEDIVAAFSKLPLDMYDTSFKGQSMKKQMVQQLYEHVTILEKGGFYVSDKLHASLSCKIASLEKCILQVLGPSKKLSDHDIREFEAEFQAMKSIALNSSITLHDVLSMSPRKIYYYIKNYFGHSMTTRLNKDESGIIRYSRSDGIAKGHFAKSLVRKYAIKSATGYFRGLIDFPLPDLCCERIFDYLDNDDLLNLCAASGGGVHCQKRKKFKNMDDFVSSNNS